MKYYICTVCEWFCGMRASSIMSLPKTCSIFPNRTPEWETTSESTNLEIWLNNRFQEKVRACRECKENRRKYEAL